MGPLHTLGMLLVVSCLGGCSSGALQSAGNGLLAVGAGGVAAGTFVATGCPMDREDCAGVYHRHYACDYDGEEGPVGAAIFFGGLSAMVLGGVLYGLAEE